MSKTLEDIVFIIVQKECENQIIKLNEQYGFRGKIHYTKI